MNLSISAGGLNLLPNFQEKKKKKGGGGVGGGAAAREAWHEHNF